MKNKKFSIEDSISLALKKDSKFDESFDVAFRLDSPTPVKGECILKHPVAGVRFLIFCSDPSKLTFLDDSKHHVFGGEELINSIKEKKSIVNECKYCISTPDLMPKVGKIAKILGPRGLMPDPKLGFVTNDIASVISSIDDGRIFFKTNKDKILHVKIGKMSFCKDELIENFGCLFESVIQLKPKNVGLQVFIQSISVSSTMGSGNFIDLALLQG